MTFIQNFSKIFLQNHFVKKSFRLILQSKWQKYQSFHTTKSAHSNQMKVTILGAMGNTGQPLSMMLKQSPLVDELCVYDIKPTKSFAMELNHIDTMCKVSGFTGKEGLGNALYGSKVVIILSAKGADCKNNSPIFEKNASIICSLAEFIGVCAPKAMVVVATNPVNSMVPLVSEVLKTKGACSPNAIFGVNTVDVVRSNTLAAVALQVPPECVIVPVIGGRSKNTIVPVLSHTKPCAEFSLETIEKITRSVRNGEALIAKLKYNGTASLASSFAIARFTLSLIKGLRGYQDVIECSYVRSKVHPQLKYFSTPLLLGPAGVMRNLGIPKLSDYEKCLLDNLIPVLVKDIQRGEKFVGVLDPPICDPCDDRPLPPTCPASHCFINPPCS